MQTKQNPSILQAEDGKEQENHHAGTGRQAVYRIPSNHRQAERKLIARVADGTFEIDSRGRIWRLKRAFGCRWHGKKIIGVPRQRAERKTTAGYLQIKAMIGGKRVCANAHRLVWQHFFGDIPDGLIMNHKNGIKDDNRPENLEIVTYSENMKHAFRHGLINQDGERNPAAKLSNEDVKQIRALYSIGTHLQVDLARQYQVSFQAISRIVRGESRRFQGGPVDDSDHRHYGGERDPVTGRFVSSED